MSVDLRTYCFLDNLQPQHAAYLGTVARGRRRASWLARRLFQRSVGDGMVRMYGQIGKSTTSGSRSGPAASAVCPDQSSVTSQGATQSPSKRNESWLSSSSRLATCSSPASRP